MDITGQVESVSCPINIHSLWIETRVGAGNGVITHTRIYMIYGGIYTIEENAFQNTIFKIKV